MCCGDLSTEGVGQRHSAAGFMQNSAAVGFVLNDWYDEGKFVFLLEGNLIAGK